MATPSPGNAFSVPASACNFVISFGGDPVGVFSHVKPPSGRLQVYEYREGGAKTLAVRLLPGRVVFEPMEVSYGFGLRPALWTWMASAMAGRPEYQDVVLTMYGIDGETSMGQYSLFRCLPTAWSVSPLSAVSHDIAIETLEIRYEGLERAAV